MAVTETGSERLANEDRLLAVLREQHPELDFHRLPEGWLALPKGTPVVSAFALSTLALKLANEAPA